MKCRDQSCKRIGQPSCMEDFFVLFCSSSGGHRRSPVPRASLQCGTYSCWWPSVPRSFSRGKESQCRVVGLNATLRQFRTLPHLFSLLAFLSFLSLVPYYSWHPETSLSGLPSALFAYLLFWSHPPWRVYILKNGGCLRF